jgi:hypothetical protein
MGVDINDVSMMVQIIDICSKRGAFEGPELQMVGQFRTKLATIVENANKEQSDVQRNEE